jgi:hypothetical protein
MSINIYIISTETLKLRYNHLNQQIGKLKKILDDKKYTCKFHQILSPNKNEIELNLDKYKERFVLNQDEINDDDFKKLNMPINTNQLSNFCKHIKAYELINKNNNNDDLHFIIEDDFIIIDEFINNFNKCLDEMKKIDYDLLFTGVSVNQEGELKFIRSFDYFKILISKASYFISKKCSNSLINYLEKIRFNFKINLSYYIWENKETIKSFITNKNIFFEGSKLGLFSTSINNNNFLYQNGDFIKLSQLIGNNEYIDDDNIKKLEEIYNNSGRNNPDFQHTLGLAYYKNKNFRKAKEFLIQATINYKNTDGFLCQYSEILNNCINMHQFEQSDIEEVLKLPGIYS